MCVCVCVRPSVCFMCAIERILCEFYYSRFVDDHSIILFTTKDIEISFCLSLSYTTKFKFPGISTFRIKLLTTGTLNLLPFIFVRYFEETKKRFDSYERLWSQRINVYDIYKRKIWILSTITMIHENNRKELPSFVIHGT